MSMPPTHALSPCVSYGDNNANCASPRATSICDPSDDGSRMGCRDYLGLRQGSWWYSGMDDARVAFDRFARTEFKRSLADVKAMLPPGTDVPTLSELRTQIMDAPPTDWNRLFVRMSPMHMFYARPDWTPRLWEQWDLIASGMRAAYAKNSDVRKTVA